MPDTRTHRDPPYGESAAADRPYLKRAPARRSVLAGNAVESLVVLGLVTLIVGLVALQAIGAFGPAIHTMSFMP
jgi:hypothetical protein